MRAVQVYRCDHCPEVFDTAEACAEHEVARHPGPFEFEVADLPGMMRRVREAGERTQGDLARRLNLARPTITQWESGDRNPPLEQVNAWADALGYRLTLKLTAKEGA